MTTPLFETLPAEIIQSVLSFLPPRSLAKLSQTSRTLHAHAQTDLFWAQFVQDSVPNFRPDWSPSPYPTWKELFVSHHPYWFLPRAKIWFSDRGYGGNAMTGSLMVARYNPHKARIEGYRLVAEHGPHDFVAWEWRPHVIIHHFNPKVQLWQEDPIVMLQGRPQGHGGSREETVRHKEAVGGVQSAIFLTQPIPPLLQESSMSLWPPLTLPATHRVRNESQSLFQDCTLKPPTFDKASDGTFRVRQWLEMRGNRWIPELRIGENVMTFSTLSEELYTPTKEKPWQGIWVGDYSGHGCEFLVVLQHDIVVSEASRLLQLELQTYKARSILEEPNSHNSTLRPIAAWPSSVQRDIDMDRPRSAEELEDGSCRGRLEAIKLTGDHNVPRGEYTWIADDIGPRGLIRIADEPTFRGARIVRSKGHIAAHEYRNGEEDFEIRMGRNSINLPVVLCK